jgi:hypothetical protein
VLHSKLVTSLTNTHQSVADLRLKAAGIANENTNSAISFALLIAMAENDSGVTIVTIVTIARYTIEAHKHICTLFLKYSSFGYVTLFRFHQVQNYFDTCGLPPSSPVDCE